MRVAVSTLLAALMLAGCGTTPQPVPPSVAVPLPAAAPPSTPASKPPGNAEPTISKPALRELFSKMAANRADMEKRVLAQYPVLTGRKLDAMVRHLSEMFTDPAFADRVHDTLASKTNRAGTTPLGLAAMDRAATSEQAAALGMQITLKGLTRLGPDDQSRYVRHAIALHRSVDVATCRAMIDSKLSARRMQETELRFTAARSDAEFEEGLAMSRRAMRAELQNSPAAPVLTWQQIDAAQAAWGRSIAARVGATPESQARLDRFKQSRAQAADADVCLVTIDFLEAMLDMKGAERVWQLQYYAELTAGVR